VSCGPPRAARLVAALLSVAALGSTARADGDLAPAQRASDAAAAAVTPRPEHVAVNVVPAVPCPPSLREVVAGQLADLTADVAWTCGDRFGPEEAFRPEGGEPGVVRVFIDLRAGGEARLTLADARGDRFVVRRVPLAHGLDELGREQIGQILRFAIIALRAGDRQTLSRTEARAAVADWPPAAAPVQRPLRAEPTQARSRPTVDVGAIWSLHALAPELPAVQELALAAGVGRVAAPLSGWLEAGYRLPASYRPEPVGVRLSSGWLRLGIAVGQSRTRRASFSAGAGVGVGRIWFAPISAAASVAPAASDAFWTGGARLWIAVALRVTSTLAVGARLVCDVAAADVHYDLHDASGTPHRVLTERRVVPGFGLGIAWRP
jgi:hypothetical protein